MADLLSSTVKRIVIESEWLPTIELDDPFAPAPPGTQPFLAMFKPKLSIYTTLSDEPVIAQPYGVPTQNWPMIKNLLIGLGILGTAALIVRHQRKLAQFAPARNSNAIHGLPSRRRKRHHRRK